jgi:hypothetical protein
MGGRPVTFLDGDIVRKHLSSELGFSREHRNLNIARIGFVAPEITKNNGIAICAPIAPYDSVRKQVRAMIEPHGGSVLVHVSTSVEVCEKRDRKGLYAKARAGIVKEFRESRTPTRRRPTRGSRSTRPSAAPRSASTRSSCTSSRRATSGRRSAGPRADRPRPAEERHAAEAEAELAGTRSRPQPQLPSNRQMGSPR